MLPVSIAIRLPSSCSQGSYAPSWEYLNLNSCHPECYPLTTLDTANAHTTYFNTTHDDKINDCGFKFSMVCQWRVLNEEDQHNLLQFAKVFPTKFLKLLICQSFTPPPFCVIQYPHLQSKCAKHVHTIYQKGGYFVL